MSATAVLSETEAFTSFREIEYLIRGFESGTLPRAQWTHHAHLTIACWYLVCYPESEAVRQIREGIRKYNRAVGIVTTNESGYHETMTLFWIRMVRSYLSKTTLECSLVGLINNLGSRYANKDLPFEYYSREHLMSWEARINWVEPDLKPLPSV
jgi:hypothetical protein